MNASAYSVQCTIKLTFPSSTALLATVTAGVANPELLAVAIPPAFPSSANAGTLESEASFSALLIHITADVFKVPQRPLDLFPLALQAAAQLAHLGSDPAALRSHADTTEHHIIARAHCKTGLALGPAGLRGDLASRG